MEQNIENTDQQFSEEESGFNLMEWIFAFIHYWYLFVFFVILALSLAFLKNRSWIPTYQTAGKVMIERRLPRRDG